MIITATTPTIAQVTENLAYIEEKKDNPALPAEIFQQIFLECPLPAILMGMISCKNLKNNLFENNTFCCKFLAIPNKINTKPDHALYVLKLAKKVDGIVSFQALSHSNLAVKEKYELNSTFIELFNPPSTFCKHLKVLNLLETFDIDYYNDLRPDGLFHLTDLSFATSCFPKWTTAIGSFTSLRRLSIRSNGVWIPEGIKQITTLKELNLFGYKTRKFTPHSARYEDYEELGKLTQLTHLGLYKLEIGPPFFTLASLTQLVSLTTSEWFKLNDLLPKLQFLSVENCSLSPNCLPSLLFYSGKAVPNTISDLTSLRYLNLRDVFFNPTQLEKLSQFTQLKGITFEGSVRFTGGCEDAKGRLIATIEKFKIQSNYQLKFDTADAK